MKEEKEKDYKEKDILRGRGKNKKKSKSKDGKTTKIKKMIQLLHVTYYKGDFISRKNINSKWE